MEVTEAFKTKPPRGGLWKYVHPISLTHFSSPNLNAIKESIWRHEESNGYPHTSEADIEDRLCANHPFACGENTPNILEKAANFAVDMGRWLKEGLPVVSEEQLQTRLDICRSCNWFRGLAGGSLMHAMCGKCGCSSIKLALGGSMRCPLGKW